MLFGKRKSEKKETSEASSLSSVTSPESVANSLLTSIQENSSMIGRNPVPSTNSSHMSGSVGVSIQGGTRGGGVHSLPTRPEVADQRVLLVGHGMSIKGMIQDVERLVIEGVVESEIVHVKELVIMAGGVFRGDGDVEDAEIAGTFEGGLTVHGVLTVCHTGHLIGKATYCRLKIDDGGRVTGQLEMLKENKLNVVAETASDLSKVKKQGPSAE